MELGLQRISQLVRPYHAIFPWKAVHIAGTNGKGTTAAFVSALLHRKGIRVGRFTSPHLIHRYDGISVDEQIVDKSTFLHHENIVKERNAKNNLNSTSFELLTATAYEIFTAAKVEVGVVECGLGGRLDATNILIPDEVLCSIITSISLDHTDILGDTISKIATEKAGIIKRATPVLLHRDLDLEAFQVIKQNADSCKAPISNISYTDNHKYSLQELWHILDLSEHQARALCAALCIYQIFYEQRHSSRNLPGPYVGIDDLREIVLSFRESLRGRLQWKDIAALTKRSKQILLDGAHNSESAKAVRAYLDDKLKGTSRLGVTWILAVSGTHNADEIFSTLIRPNDSVILTSFGSVECMPWVKPQKPENLLVVASKIVGTDHVFLSKNAGDSLNLACEKTWENGEIVVAGSLYLVADVLRILDETESETLEAGKSSRYSV